MNWVIRVNGNVCMCLSMSIIFNENDDDVAVVYNVIIVVISVVADDYY